MGDVSGSDGAPSPRPGRPNPLDRAILVDDAGALASQRDDDRVVRPSLRPDAPEAVVAELERPTRAAMKAAAARRRRVVIVLLAATVIVGVVSAFGYLPLWSAAVPVCPADRLLVAGPPPGTARQRGLLGLRRQPVAPKRPTSSAVAPPESTPHTAYNVDAGPTTTTNPPSP